MLQLGFWDRFLDLLIRSTSVLVKLLDGRLTNSSCKNQLTSLINTLSDIILIQIMIASKLFIRSNLLNRYRRTLLSQIFFEFCSSNDDVAKTLKRIEKGKTNISAKKLAQVLNSKEISPQTGSNYILKLEPSKLEQLCAESSKSLSFNTNYFSIILNYYQQNLDQLLAWKIQGNKQKRLMQLRFLSKMIQNNPHLRGINEHLRKHIISYNLTSQELIHVHFILTEQRQHHQQIQEQIWQQSVKLAKAEFNKKNLLNTLEILQIRSFELYFSTTTIFNYLKFLEDHCDKLDQDTIHFILQKCLKKKFNNFFEKFLKLLINRSDFLRQQLQMLLCQVLSSTWILAPQYVKKFLDNFAKYEKLFGAISPQKYLDYHYFFIQIGQENFPKEMVCLWVNILFKSLQNPNTLKTPNSLSIYFYLLKRLLIYPSVEDLNRLKNIPIESMVQTFSDSPYFLLVVTYAIHLSQKVRDSERIEKLCKLAASVATKDDVFEMAAIFSILTRQMIKVFPFDILDLNLDLNIQHFKIKPLNKLHRDLIKDLLRNTFSAIGSTIYDQDTRKKDFLKKIQPLLEKSIKKVDFRVNFKFFERVLFSYRSTVMDKYLFSLLEQKFMNSISKQTSHNFIQVNSSFRKIARLVIYKCLGSRKFQTFLQQCLNHPQSFQISLKNYYKRQHKFQQMRQKQRVDKINTKRLQNINDKKKNFFTSEKNEK